MKKLFMSMAALSMLLAACQKEDTNNNEGVGKIKVTANLSQGETTKVDVDSDGLGVYWTNGDAVSVFAEKSYAGQLTTFIKEKSKKADFEGEVAETTENNYYILYPYAESHMSSDGMSINLNLLNLQCPNPNDLTYLGKYMYMVSKNPGQIDNNRIMKFGMEHLTALIQFSVFLAEPKEGIELFQVILTGDNLRSECNLNIYDKSVEYTSQAVISLGFETPIELSSMWKTFFIPVFPNEGGDFEITLMLFDHINGGELEKRIPIHVNKTEAGKRYTKMLPVMTE